MSFPSPIAVYDSSMVEEILMTPAVFRRIWFHTTEVKSEICSSGWNPEKIKNSMFGSAIYLARRRWDLDNVFGDLVGSIDRASLVNGLKHPKMIACVLALRTNEVMSSFPSPPAPNGSTDKHLLDYLNKNVPRKKTAPAGLIRRAEADGTTTTLQFGRTPGPGNNEKNRKIACHFLTKGIKAIRFLERGEEVAAIYDPNCIRVLPGNADFEAHPFSDRKGRLRGRTAVSRVSGLVIGDAGLETTRGRNVRRGQGRCQPSRSTSRARARQRQRWTN